MQTTLETVSFKAPWGASWLLLCAALAAAPAAWAQATPAKPAASQAAGPTVRAQFATPMTAAQALLAEGRVPEALVKLDEAAALPDRTAYETMALERLRAAAAQRQGQSAQVLKSLEAALATGEVAAADEAALVEVLVSVATREKDHAKVLRWAQRYAELKGTNDVVGLMRIQSQIATGDERGATAALVGRQEAADKAGQALPEQPLRWLYALQQKAKDPAATGSLERLAQLYPRPEYWADLVVGASRRVGDNDRALADLYRLLRVAGALTVAELHHGLADTALRVGQPSEALVVLEEGYAAGVLGTGTEATAQQKLRELARKQAGVDVADRPAAETAARRAADGNALVQLGWSIVAALPAGTAGGDAAERGLALIEQGIAKGGLRRPTEAQLHLGAAQHLAGRKDAARQTFAALAKSAASTDPLAEPIRLWAMWSAVPAMLPKAN